MGDQFTLKVYNYSPAEITFKLKNVSCMYLPQKTEINVAAYTWGEFEALEINNSVGSACFATDSKFDVLAYRGKALLGHTTYRASNTLKRMFFGFPNGLSVHNRDMNGPLDHNLMFERVESYGDLFFNGRGVYVENSIKSEMSATSLGQKESTGVDEMLPTSLVNSNKHYVDFDEANALITAVTNWVSLGLKVKDVYPFIKSLDSGPKAAKSIADQQWDRFMGLLPGYYMLYKEVVAKGSEITVHCCGVDDVPALHLLFTDSTEKTEEIIAGDFYLPPPNSNNTFYQNIKRLSEKAARKKKKTVAKSLPSPLKPGQYLSPGEELLSTNQRFVLQYRKDGSFQLFDAEEEKTLWETGTGGLGAWRCSMEKDGNLVIYAKEKNAVWAAYFDGGPVPGSELVVRDDGRLAIIDPNGARLWNGAIRRRQTDTLKPGAPLFPRQEMASDDGRYVLRYLENGNLVFLDTDSDKILWQTSTVGKAAGQCVVQESDGAFAVYDRDGKVAWDSNKKCDLDGKIIDCWLSVGYGVLQLYHQHEHPSWPGGVKESFGLFSP